MKNELKCSKETSEFLNHCFNCYDRRKENFDNPLVLDSWDEINRLKKEQRLNKDKSKKVTYFDGWVNIFDSFDDELLDRRHEEKHENEIDNMLILNGFYFMVIPKRFCIDRDVFGKMTKEEHLRLDELCNKYNLNLCSTMKRKTACKLQVECYEEKEHDECFLFSYEINKKYGEKS